MGKKLSVDKSPSPLEEVTSTPLATYSKARDDFPDPPPSVQHLRIWRFFVDSRDPEYVVSAGVNLTDAGVAFGMQDCYLVLLVYRQQESQQFSAYPQSLWTSLESLANLTPRGLESVFSSDFQDLMALDSFLLSRKDPRSDTLHYLMFLWNGKQASAIVKAMALTKGFELDGFLSRGKENVLRVLANGGIVKGKRIQKGAVATLETLFESDRSVSAQPKRTVYLLKWLLSEQPAPSPPKPLFQKFKHYFLSQKPDAQQAPLFIPVTCDLPLKPKNKAVEPDPPAKPALPKIPDLKPVPKLQMNVGQKPGMLPLKLSGLKTQEDERKELENLDKQGLDNLDEDVNIRDTNRKELKLQMYSDICSELMPGLYVGSDIVARDKGKLHSYGITHVINCAGNVCANYFPEEFTYLSYFLKDTRMESIECLFHEVVEFVEQAHEEGGSVFVHCMQGVSRSVTACMAYMIFKQRETFENVFLQARQKRGISSPNFGFQVQLIHWHKRLFEPFDAFPITPRVFAVGSHQVEQPHKIVCRLLIQPPFTGVEPAALDPRGVFIVQTAQKLFVWEGAEIPECNYDVYMAAARIHVRRLQEHEKASKSVAAVQQGRESADFWQCWGLAGPPANAYGEQEVWTQYYPPLDAVEDQEPSAAEESGDDIDLEERAKLYVYPEVQGIGVFDDDELVEDAMLCLCYKSILYVWRGDQFNADEVDEEEFIDGVKAHFWSEGAEVKVENEVPGRESDEFLSFF